MAEYLKPVVFKLGEDSYGIDINFVSSIEKQISVVPVPNSLQYIKGIINLRGEVIPVFSLKRKFNMDGSATDGENTIIVKLGDVTIALEVDGVEEIQDINVENIVNMPQIVKTENLMYFDKVAHVGDKLIILLDLNYLLSEREQDTVKSLTETLQN